MTSPTRTRTARKALALSLALALGAAACGDDDADTAGEDVATEQDDSGDESTDESPDDADGDDPDTDEPDQTGTNESDEDSAAANGGDDIGDVATAAGATFVPGYTEFAPGYAEAVEGEGPVTALMPSDDAFIAFSQKYPELTGTLREDFELLDQVLSYHVIDGEMLADAIAGESELTTLQGEPIAVSVDGDSILLNGGEATLTEADLEASNGVVHILDGILLPPSIAETAS